jgi:hypothetical protein
MEITLKLPDDLAQDAKELDVLDDKTLTRLIRQEVDDRVNEMVNEEIHTYRDEKRHAGE